MAKWIFTTEFKGQRVFIVCRSCKGLLDIEKRVGCTIEPTGLTDDIFGRGFIANRGQIYSLKGFKSLLNSLGY